MRREETDGSAERNQKICRKKHNFEAKRFSLRCSILTIMRYILNLRDVSMPTQLLSAKNTKIKVQVAPIFISVAPGLPHFGEDGEDESDILLVQ